MIPALSPVLAFGAVGGITVPPVQVANNSTYGPSTLATTANIPAGSLIIVYVNCSTTNSTVTGMSDGGLNTYSTAIATTANAAVYGSTIFYCINCNAVPSGTTFTATGTAGTGPWWPINIYYVLGANGGMDIHVTQNGTTAGLSLSQASGALAAPGELIVANWYSNLDSTGFTTNFNILGSMQLQLASSTSSVTGLR